MDIEAELALDAIAGKESKAIIIEPKDKCDGLPEGTRFTVTEEEIERHTGDGDCFYGNRYLTRGDRCYNCGTIYLYTLEPIDG